MYVLNNFPYIKQSANSSCCGAYSIWMVDQYLRFKLKTPKKFDEMLDRYIGITPQQLIKKCKVSKKWGTETKDLVRVLKELGYTINKLTKNRRYDIKDIKKSVDNGFPVIVVVHTEATCSHWCVIKGYTDNAFIFADSYYGDGAIRYFDELNYRMDEIYSITVGEL